jgi:hypothetical protein
VHSKNAESVNTFGIQSSKHSKISYCMDNKRLTAFKVKNPIAGKTMALGSNTATRGQELKKTKYSGILHYYSALQSEDFSKSIARHLLENQRSKVYIQHFPQAHKR